MAKKRTIVKKQVEIGLEVLVSKQQKYWIAYSPALKTYGYSDKNKEGALKDLDVAIKTFFHVQNTLGILNKTLLNLGWVREENDHVKITAPKIYSNLPPYRDSETRTTLPINIPELV